VPIQETYLEMLPAQLQQNKQLVLNNL